MAARQNGGEEHSAGVAWRGAQEVDCRLRERPWAPLTLESCADGVEARTLRAQHAQRGLWVPLTHQRTDNTCRTEAPSDHRIWCVEPEDAGALAQRPAVARVNERPTAERDDASNAELGGNFACGWSNFAERRNSRALANAEALFAFALEDLIHAVLRDASAGDDAAVKVEEWHVQCGRKATAERALPHAREADECKVAAPRRHQRLVVAAGPRGAGATRVRLGVSLATCCRCGSRDSGTCAERRKVCRDLF